MAQQTRGVGPSEHFTISNAGFNRPWAYWIAHQLEELGHETSLLRWDPPLNQSLADALRGLLAAPGRILLVLDDWYFRVGPRTEDEWTEALREVVPEHADRFATVSVATRALPSTAAALRPVDLRDLDEREARRRILRRLGLDPEPLPAAENGGPVPRFPNDPPAVWNTPSRNARFTGRDPVLEEIHRQLEEGGREGARCALRGISGVGKSQIALEYAHRFAYNYDVVWWVNSGYRATAREQFADLATRLDLPVGDELGERIRVVQEALRTGRPHRRWLVIFDSADDMAQVEDLLPEGHGHVLITTLTHDWAGSGGVGEIEVTAFTRAESVAYVRRRANRLTDAEADQLADAVQDLPLLLGQTAAWLAANQMPAKEYIAMIRRGEAGMIGIRISSDYPMGFQTSWSITLNTLQDKNPEAVELLHLFGLFSPEAIPVRLIQSTRHDGLPEHLSALSADPIRWHTALRRLSESTAVRMEYLEDGDEAPYVERVSMHRLYHSFLLSTLTEDQRDALSAVAGRVLADADPRNPSDTRFWSAYSELIPHLENAGTFNGADPAVRKLVLNCIQYLRLRGETRTPIRICEQAVGRWRQRLTLEDPDLATLVQHHANLLRIAGRYQEAQAVGQATVDQLTELRPPEDPYLLSARIALGGTLMAQAKYQEAYRIFSETVAVSTRIFGEEAPRTLQDRNNLASILGLLGRYEESLGQQRAILQMRERVFKPRHHLTLSTAQRYARMLRLLGHYTVATSRQDLNVQMVRQVMGRFNPQTMVAEHNLAMCLRRGGDVVGAEALLRTVRDRFIQHSGPMGPDCLMVQADYATLVRQRGDLDRARELTSVVASRYRTLTGPDHPYAVGTAGNVGLVLWELGERDEALTIAEKAWRGMAAAVGEGHPWTVGCALNVSGARHFAGDDEGALAAGQEALAGARAMLGDTHPLTLSCKAAVADDLRTLRHAQDGAKLEAETLAQLSETLGAQHAHTLAVRRRERPYWDFEPQPI